YLYTDWRRTFCSNPDRNPRVRRPIDNVRQGPARVHIEGVFFSNSITPLGGQYAPKAWAAPDVAHRHLKMVERYGRVFVAQLAGPRNTSLVLSGIPSLANHRSDSFVLYVEGRDELRGRCCGLHAEPEASAACSATAR